MYENISGDTKQHMIIINIKSLSFLSDTYWAGTHGLHSHSIYSRGAGMILTLTHLHYCNILRMQKCITLCTKPAG